MKKKTKVIVSSALSMAVCASLIAGGTLALFSSESNVNIAITSGKVDVKASVTEMWTSSSITDEYEWEEATNGSGTLSGKFENEGTAEYTEGELKLNNISPGDAVKFKLNIENNSTIAIKYQLRATSTSDEGGLFQYLKFKFGEEEISGKGPILTDGEWTEVEPDGKIDDAEFIISLPYEVGNVAMGLNCNLAIGVLAIQGNGHYDEEAVVNEIPNSAGSATVDETKEDVKLESNNHLVIIEVPADDIQDGATELSLKVAPATEEEKSQFEIVETSGASAVYYDITVTGVENDGEVSEPFTVKIYVGKNLRTVQVYHWNEETKTKDYIEDVEYDNETGFITFKTTSFSPFAIIGYDSIVPDVAPDADSEKIVAALTAAIEKAEEGETIFLPAGNYKIDSQLKIEKNITLRGEEGTKIVSSQNVKGVIDIAAENVTIENVEFSLTEENVADFAFITASKSFTVKNCTFEAKYQDGQSFVTRAILPQAGVNGYVIEGNTFKNIRQPAYLEGEGLVKNNVVSGTRGFVVTCNHEVTFEGNRFSENAEDIAVIPNNAENKYTIGDALEMSKNNHNALVDIQPLGVFVTGNTIEAKGKDTVSPSDAFINALSYVNALESNTTPIIIRLGEGEFSPTSNELFHIKTNNVQIVGESSDKTIINGKTFSAGMAAFEVNADNVSIENVTIETEITENNNMAALKVTFPNVAGTYSNVEEIDFVENFKLSNAIIVGCVGHGLNLHGVKGATINNVTVNKYGKCAVSFAMATGVNVSNLTTVAGGWGDIGFMYKADSVDYEVPCDVTVNFASCKLANGKVYSERPSEAKDGADVIRSNGKAIEDGDTVTDAYVENEDANSVLVMTVNTNGTWAIVRKATFDAADSDEFAGALDFANGTSGQVTVNGPSEVDATQGNIEGAPDYGMDIEAGADLIIDGTQADGSKMVIKVSHTAFNNMEGLEGIPSGKIVIKNVRFEATTENFGYAMTLGFGFTGEVTFENCEFVNLYAGIYCQGHDGNTGADEGNAHVVFNNCTFSKVSYGYGVNYKADLWSEDTKKGILVEFNSCTGLEENNYRDPAVIE